jgi:4-hydroxy-4-methyl-2-oxoglutarate aldolase
MAPTPTAEQQQRLDLYDRMAKDLYVAVISDVLDRLGYRHQVMTTAIRPIDPLTRAVTVGRAHTVRFTPAFEVVESPYTVQIAAIDALQPGDIPILATGGYLEASYWGELFSNAAIGRGARGVIMEGSHRDTRKVLELGFPVFSTGARPFDISGRAMAVDYGRPVVCGGVRIEPGDIVFAEVDGIVVIPAAVADEVITGAFAKVATEDRAREDLLEGALLSEVWAKYRVL